MIRGFVAGVVWGSVVAALGLVVASQVAVPPGQGGPVAVAIPAQEKVAPADAPPGPGTLPAATPPAATPPLATPPQATPPAPEVPAPSLPATPEAEAGAALPSEPGAADAGPVAAAEPAAGDQPAAETGTAAERGADQAPAQSAAPEDAAKDRVALPETADTPDVAAAPEVAGGGTVSQSDAAPAPDTAATQPPVAADLPAAGAVGEPSAVTPAETPSGSTAEAVPPAVDPVPPRAPDSAPSAPEPQPLPPAAEGAVALGDSPAAPAADAATTPPPQPDTASAAAPAALEPPAAPVAPPAGAGPAALPGPDGGTAATADLAPPAEPSPEVAPGGADLPPPPPLSAAEEARLAALALDPTLPIPGLDGDASGVTVGRLPRIGESAAVAPAPVIAPGDDTRPPVERYSRPFENPVAKPLFALLLRDTGGPDVDRTALAALPFPVSFVIDPLAPDAGTAAAIYRAAGQEVLMLATGIPAGATAADLEVTFAAHATALPEAVAVIDLPDDGFQDSAQLAGEVATLVQAQGRGLMTYERGLNPADQVARRQGVPAATVFRTLDAEDEASPAIRRYLDRAAFKAAQEGRVAVIGTTRPETVAALLEWSVEGRASSVALAPASAVLAVQ
ncbi:divergent polysaccharide deacetylase family protein [Fertoebacter nigrum]|uniref:Divergent polysaccharide deacetylase family protein n=1 Tax=Fertoeibacter niger TaxID=2656921 RepID=A0A8X8GYG9_9RHOB|nr:divergent polysaccharide deacetylase family protein [Fertoeibacter niger]